MIIPAVGALQHATEVTPDNVLGAEISTAFCAHVLRKQYQLAADHFLVGQFATQTVAASHDGCSAVRKFPPN